ncbi:MAG: hypothetical protein ABI358_07800 [Ginsengibacter sp.]
MKNFLKEMLIYGEEYLCYFKGEYIGMATFIDDPHIGDSFMKIEVNKNGRIEEIAIMPDRWALP